MKTTLVGATDVGKAVGVDQIAVGTQIVVGISVTGIATITDVIVSKTVVGTLEIGISTTVDGKIVGFPTGIIGMIDVGTYEV